MGPGIVQELGNGSAASMPTSASSSTLEYISMLASKITTERWNSFIGIVTAIVGNVLISLALNTQRYAHLRLQKESLQEAPSGKPYRDGDSDEDADVENGYGATNGDASSKTRPEAGTRSMVKLDGHAEDDDESGMHSPLLASRFSMDSQATDATARERPRPGLDAGKKQNYLKSPYWWVGIILMAIGEAGNFLAYGFAPASVVSPLGVVALISNCLIAPIMLKEQFRKRDILGVVIAVGGAVVVVLSAKDSNPKLGPDEVFDLVKRWEFLTYLGITVTCILALMSVSKKYGHKTILIDIGLVGLFGGYTALSTKGVASLISYELWKVLTFPITYVLVLVLVGTALAQIKYVNRALQRFDSTQVIPTQFVMFTVFVVAGSAILYRDFERENASKILQFFGGVALTFLGVWCITGGRGRGKDSAPPSDFDEEDRINLVDNEEPDHPLASARQSEDTAPAAPSTPTTTKHFRTPNMFQTPAHLRARGDYDSPATFVSASSNFPPHTNSSPSLIQNTPSSSSPRRRSAQFAPGTASGAFQPQTPGDQPFSTPSLPRHSHDSSGPSPRPNANSTPNSMRHNYRHSMVESLYPQPFTSPLSSGLSVVVADTLRRGYTQDSTGRRSRASSARRSRGELPFMAPSSEPRLSSEARIIGPRGQTPVTASQRDSIDTFSSVASSTTSTIGGATGAGAVDDQQDTERVEGEDAVGRPELARAPHSVEVAISSPEQTRGGGWEEAEEERK